MDRYYLEDPAESLPAYVALSQPVTVRLGPIDVALDPRTVGRPYLMRSDLAVLEIVKDQLGKRPIYFSTSTGSYADQLGLSPYLVGEGLVRRVASAPVAPGDSIRRVEGRGFLNVPRAARWRPACTRAARRRPGRGRAAGWTCRRRTACSHTSFCTTPSPPPCTIASRRSRPR